MMIDAAKPAQVNRETLRPESSIVQERTARYTGGQFTHSLQ